jgi:hypothetical protein
LGLFFVSMISKIFLINHWTYHYITRYITDYMTLYRTHYYVINNKWGLTKFFCFA